MYNLNLFLKIYIIVIAFNCIHAYAWGYTLMHHLHIIIVVFWNFYVPFLPNNLKSWIDQFHGQFSPSPWDDIFYGTNLALWI